MNDKHVGSDLDGFLRHEGLLERAKTVAVKRILASQIAAARKAQRLSKAVIATPGWAGAPAEARLAEALFYAMKQSAE